MKSESKLHIVVGRVPVNESAAIIDGSLSIITLFLIIAYHVWYYSWRFGRNIIEARGYHRVDLTGQRARQIFVRSIVYPDHNGQDAAETNVALQAVRNPITAESILATGATLGATTLVNILLDADKMEAVRQLGRSDPLTGGSALIKPEFKMACAIGVLFLSFFSLAQSLRLYIHFGFFARAAAWAHKHPDEYSEETIAGMFGDACNTCLRAQTFFSVGLRFMYCFLPLIFWFLGSTYLLLATLGLVVAMYSLDKI